LIGVASTGLSDAQAGLVLLLVLLRVVLLLVRQLGRLLHWLVLLLRVVLLLWLVLLLRVILLLLLVLRLLLSRGLNGHLSGLLLLLVFREAPRATAVLSERVVNPRK
jgi:hypothetical protein